MLTSEAILNWVQTIGVLAALTFTGYELYRRNREQRFRNYLDHMVIFFDATKLLVENKDLHPLYDYSWVDIDAVSYEQLAPDQKARVHYCDVLIGLCETVWVANKEGWLDNTEWPYIKEWIRQLAQSPDFRWTVNWVTDDYSHDFMTEVRVQVSDAIKGATEQIVGREPR
jgi:hypothetical protein